MDIKDMARLGGLARAKKLSPERRREIALKAVQAREKKRAAKRKQQLSPYRP